MQKALFADERISKVAENPKTSAFLRTIEDRGSDEEMDFLFPADKEDTQKTTTSSQGAEVAVPDSQPERLPAPQRRGSRRKPTTIGDIRASLSDLLEDAIPETSQIIPATASDHSDDDADEDQPDKENLQPPPKPTNPRRREAVVDRISLKRNSSSSLSTRSSRLAFAPSSTAGFKVAALLRRATTNSATNSSATTSSITGSGAPKSGGNAGGFGEESKIKRNAGKRSGINYFARENERRAALEEGERRREAKKVRGAEGRSKVVGGLFAGGKFE
jgi:mediator of replication checkpoint protein 1